MDKKVVALFVFGVIFIIGGLVAGGYALNNYSTYSIGLTGGLVAVGILGVVGGLASVLEGMKRDSQ